jgi:hyperosmotically inducible protein
MRRSTKFPKERSAAGHFCDAKLAPNTKLQSRGSRISRNSFAVGEKLRPKFPRDERVDCAVMVRFVHPRIAYVVRAAMEAPSGFLRAAHPLALAGLMVAGAATLPAAWATGNDAENGGSDRPVTDTWITTKVKTELATTQSVKSMNIDVKTVDGAVTLAGVLSSEIAVQKAIAAAKGVKGVKSVDASGLKADAPSRR